VDDSVFELLVYYAVGGGFFFKEMLWVVAPFRLRVPFSWPPSQLCCLIGHICFAADVSFFSLHLFTPPVIGGPKTSKFRRDFR